MSMSEKTYDDLRRFMGDYMNIMPGTEGTLTEYAQWFAKNLHHNRMDTPASHLMVELAAYIDRLQTQDQSDKGGMI